MRTRWLVFVMLFTALGGVEADEVPVPLIACPGTEKVVGVHPTTGAILCAPDVTGSGGGTGACTDDGTDTTCPGNVTATGFVADSINAGEIIFKEKGGSGTGALAVGVSPTANLPDGVTKDCRADSAGEIPAACVQSRVPTNAKATGYTVGADDPREAYGGVLYVTASATLGLPAVAPGMHLTIKAEGAVTVTLNPNGTEVIVRDGTTQAGGLSVVSPGTTGALAVCVYRAASTWDCSTGSNTGTLWAQGS